ncbi:MAG: L,D-transpeptidase family protein [Rhodomicrobium sp.]
MHNGSSGNPIDDLSAMRFLKLPKESLRTRGFPLRSGRVLSLTLLALATLASAAEPASARILRHRHLRIERESDAKLDFKRPVGPLYAVVSLADQHVTFYDANGLWARGLVSTGVPGHPTPTGIFTILEKERWHRSNIYSGAPMPFMQRLAWTGVAMHEGAVFPGHTASHGCIRLQAAFARQLFAVTNTGQRVIIAPQDITPTPIVNAHLPVPELQMLPLEAAVNKTASNKNGAVEPVALEPLAASSAQAKAVNPLEFAKVMKTAAAAKAAAAIVTKKTALALLEPKSAEARLAARELDGAESALKEAQEELKGAARVAADAQGEDATKKAAENKTAAEAKVTAAELKVREARDAKAAKDQEILAAQTSIRDADAAAVEAAAAAKQAVRRQEPLSMFISRKTGRLYVRQATEHLFDIPVTIRDPQRPLGTHLFIATQAGDDGASLRWVSLTPPAAAEVIIRPHSSRRGQHIFREEDEAGPAQSYPETAAGALDRIEIPEEASKRISELLWTGATLIISDVGMSGEGRYPMDFIILEQTRIRVYD